MRGSSAGNQIAYTAPFQSWYFSWCFTQKSGSLLYGSGKPSLSQDTHQGTRIPQTPHVVGMRLPEQGRCNRPETPHLPSTTVIPNDPGYMRYARLRYNVSMHKSMPLDTIDYLVVGHITIDQTPEGPQIGGTASYAALTARVLGLRVGIVTSWGEEVSPEPLQGIPIINYYAEKSTIFQNIQTPSGRRQIIHNVAPQIDFHMIPETWRSASIVHLGPVAQEVEPGMVRYFPSALIGLTPQGWLRSWDHDGLVTYGEWPEAGFVLNQAGAVVLSLEDVNRDEIRLDEFVFQSKVLAVTEANEGARLYWNADVRRFRAQPLDEVDSTGAGDIFAAAFFYRLHTTQDPWEAARFATYLSSLSVTRVGLAGIPTADEVAESKVEIL
jgi:hypothetical protein